MEIRNKTLFRAGQGVAIVAVLLIFFDSQKDIFGAIGMWGTAIPLLLIAIGGFMIDRATDGTWWNRD